MKAPPVCQNNLSRCPRPPRDAQPRLTVLDVDGYTVLDVDVDLLDARAGGGAGRGICAMGVLRRRSRHLDVEHHLEVADRCP